MTILNWVSFWMCALLDGAYLSSYARANLLKLYGGRHMDYISISISHTYREQTFFLNLDGKSPLNSSECLYGCIIYVNLKRSLKFKHKNTLRPSQRSKEK